jgi:bifunctional DNase/RNase
METVRCEVLGVFAVVTEHSTSPVVLLTLPDERCLPIYIGLWEAISIDHAIRGEIPPRPLTHDLFIEMLTAFSITLDSLRIDTLEGGVFYGRLLLRGQGLNEQIDCRPSDGIALAIRCGAGVLVEEEVANNSSVKRDELPQLIDLSNYLYG